MTKSAQGRDTLPARKGKPATIAKKTEKTRAKPGPKPDVLKIEGDWEAAVAKSFAKKKPAGGWPKAPTGKKT